MTLNWEIISWSVGLVVMWSGVLVGVIRWLVVRAVADVDRRVTSAERRVDCAEEDVRKLLAELPIAYQRRDDAIREYSAINVKLDRLYTLLLAQREQG